MRLVGGSLVALIRRLHRAVLVSSVLVVRFFLLDLIHYILRQLRHVLLILRHQPTVHIPLLNPLGLPHVPSPADHHVILEVELARVLAEHGVVVVEEVGRLEVDAALLLPPTLLVLLPRVKCHL